MSQLWQRTQGHSRADWSRLLTAAIFTAAGQNSQPIIIQPPGIDEIDGIDVDFVWVLSWYQNQAPATLPSPTNRYPKFPVLFVSELIGEDKFQTQHLVRAARQRRVFAGRRVYVTVNPNALLGIDANLSLTVGWSLLPASAVPELLRPSQTYCPAHFQGAGTGTNVNVQSFGTGIGSAGLQGIMHSLHGGGMVVNASAVEVPAWLCVFATATPVAGTEIPLYSVPLRNIETNNLDLDVWGAASCDVSLSPGVYTPPTAGMTVDYNVRALIQSDPFINSGVP